MTAKQAIDGAVIGDRDQTLLENGFSLPGINGFLALLSVQDPFLEKPEETYGRIEDFVIDNLEALLDQTVPKAEEVAHRSCDSLGHEVTNEDLDFWIEAVTKMAASALVERIMEISGTQEMILERYSRNAICGHVHDRAKDKMKKLGRKVDNNFPTGLI